jgi:hypothetical protein
MERRECGAHCRDAMIKKALVVILPVLLFAGCGSGIDQKKFENVNRAAKSVDAATGIGINHQDFTNLLQKFAAEISILRDQIKSEKEKTVFDAYAKVLEAYQDSNTVWINEIEDGDHPVRIISELAPIVERYNLPTKTYEGVMGGYEQGLVSPGQSIRIIWKEAANRLDQANRLRMGEKTTRKVSNK